MSFDRLVFENKIKILKRFYKGTRSNIFLCEYGNKKGIIKKHYKKSLVKKEALFLEKLYPLTPKVFEIRDDFIFMQYIEGLKFGLSNKEMIKLALTACYEMDINHIYHTELGRFSHLIFDKNIKWVKIIDFEKAKNSPDARNVFQLIGFYFKNYDLKEEIMIYKTNKELGLKKIIERLC